MNRSTKVFSIWFPEVFAGGYTSLDGTLEFYGRINALLRPSMNVLDFGAGRGVGLQEDRSDFRKMLRTLRHKSSKIVGCDVDEAVLSNPGLDEAVVIKPDASLPFDDASFDLIVCDFVFEHIDNPARVTQELRRILKRGGWLCARTPNKYCLVSILTRMIRNSRHSKILRWVQPERREIDVFPTVFKLNSKRAIAKFFDDKTFNNYTYRYEAEPSYFFNNHLVFSMMLLLNRLSPPIMKSNLFVFLQKK